MPPDGPRVYDRIAELTPPPDDRVTRDKALQLDAATLTHGGKSWRGRGKKGEAMTKLSTPHVGLTVVTAMLVASQAFAGRGFPAGIGSAIAGGGNFKLKNAVVMVRPLACDDPASVVMTGSAVGIVNGAGSQCR